MPSPSLAVVVVEDERHRMLVYRYLLERGLSRHQIRIKPSPSGRGSAEQWVRAMYAAEVKEYRIRRAKAATALIVMIDADTHSVQGRLAQLGHALQENGAHSIRNDEQIAHLIPKRNVETWIRCLNEHVVDEATDYKEPRDDWNELITRASETLFQWTRPNTVLPTYCIDSLRKGVSELNQLKF
jgi:hypothetical protein